MRLAGARDGSAYEQNGEGAVRLERVSFTLQRTYPAGVSPISEPLIGLPPVGRSMSLLSKLRRVRQTPPVGGDNETRSTVPALRSSPAVIET